jgi:hypothetical protein
VQVVRIYLWSEWLCAKGLCVTCNGTYIWGYIILILVSCSLCCRVHVCVETPALPIGANMLTLSVVLQEFAPRRFLYAKALYVNVYNIHCYM